MAVATDYSFIASTATMTIHPIRLTGMVIGVPQTYEYLDKMQDRVVKFVVQNSRISERRYRELMFRTGELARDIGTILVGRDAVKEGIIDEVGGLAQAVAKLNQLVSQKKGTAVPQGPSLLPGPQAMPPAYRFPSNPASGPPPGTTPGTVPGVVPGPTPGPADPGFPAPFQPFRTPPPAGGNPWRSEKELTDYESEGEEED